MTQSPVCGLIWGPRWCESGSIWGDAGPFQGRIRQRPHGLQRETAAEAERSREFVATQITRSMAELRSELSREIGEANESLRNELAAVRGDLGRELPAAAADINSGITASAGAMVKKFDAELKQTNKALTSLARKFERFDDRITVQTKDQDQRLRKLERRA